jgi:hypothetical protein
MKTSLTRLVWRRADGRCEYCQIHQDDDESTFEIDHIVARKHRGATVAGNLALSCFHCNSHKGPNLSGIDPKSRRIIRLFHPRRHKWNWHFHWQGGTLLGRTPIGRATIAVLEINDEFRVQLRENLIDDGRLPPV